ncbi:MAG: CHRD domain-containing protein [Bacteroidia bacterium]|nr:CHRD domain-containing protein [Bacteroidia bacterium]MBT8277525.1 CHRD domain-containing protein [Bacteroidia bacterium]NND25420.1 CHRD domain-containing protein [Flavobacteriaceae bacterium]NNK60590.1 CHRD domain-containing protein [Flavobacteriaceae bacterium]RZW51175.1 MAG: CHRD domain-containing protein [Flavobacteriaceae bacterium]
MFLFSGCSPESQGVTSDEELRAHSKKRTYTTSLNGRNEVPSNESKGAGVAIVKISKDGNSIWYKVNTANVDDVWGAHFHLAPEGSNGGVVAALYANPDQPSGPANGVLAQGVITAEDVVGALAGDLDALIQAIKDGMIYVNVHTEGIPSGELRGQL